MTELRIPFHRAVVDDDAIRDVVEVLRSGWLTTGARCRAFEEAFAARIGDDVHAIAVNSATAALHLGLEAVGVRVGDLVLTTPYTFAATAEVIRHLGADPVFVDVDPVTGNLTPELVADAYERLSPGKRARVRALVPVHIAGLPCDLAALSALAEEHGWALVDDAAHALPATSAGRTVGTVGDVTAFSFYVTKTLNTGEGGMAVTRDDRLASRMRTMRLHGIDRDVFDRYRSMDAWYYEVADAGFKYNLTDVAAALGLAGLRHLDADRDARAAIAATYTTAFADLDGLVTPPPASVGDLHAWHLYMARVRLGGAVRDELVRQLAAHGVGTSVHFIPLHLQPYYRRRYGLTPADLPGATQLFHQELSLPLFPTMRPDEVVAVVEAVTAALPMARDAALTAHAA